MWSSTESEKQIVLHENNSSSLNLNGWFDLRLDLFATYAGLAVSLASANFYCFLVKKKKN